MPRPESTGFSHPKPAFDVVPLGVKGGLDESNLSAYLVAPTGSQDFICLDAGTVYSGVRQAVRQRVFRESAEAVIRRRIRAYCISHPHVDHVAGLLLNAPDDTAKSIYGTEACLRVLQRDYFNWQTWPNFGDAGPAPSLRKYQLRTLAPGEETSVPTTALSVRAFPLSHGPNYPSTAFLVRYEQSYVLYLGDTGADELEHSQRLRELWQAVQPLVAAGQLRGIFIEASYPNEQPDNQLYGHLTPTRLLQELGVLGQLTGPEALRGLPVIVTHLKPTSANEATIRRQLAAANTLGLRLIFPRQGQRLRL
ncbi:3',5'-cyclic-nucleotide phosphodiesterase [Hymenobacter sp. CRA2]|nr:3',5'-cyclic-nucleotide phosphodiesterase [Hymenobacter sp. CRA2]